MIAGPHYPAKVILFGEYAVLLGSSSLGIPYRDFSACLRKPGKVNKFQGPQEKESNNEIDRLFYHLYANRSRLAGHLDLARLSQDIGLGLYLSSTIPMHSGLGSSGALSAALFGSYGSFVHHTYTRLMQILGEIESFFHGTSSGFDPLLSFLNRPLRRNGSGGTEIHTWSSDELQNHDIFLVDSGIRSSTRDMVKDFLAIHFPGGRLSHYGEMLKMVTDQCIVAFTTNNLRFKENLSELSRLQLTGMEYMIPDPIKELWETGLHEGAFTMKLCGSGGGGQYLLFMHHREKAEQILSHVSLKSISHDNYVDQSVESHSTHFF